MKKPSTFTMHANIQVEKLDFDGRKAFVRQVDSDYFTDAIVYTQVSEFAEFENAIAAAPSAGAMPLMAKFA